MHLLNYVQVSVKVFYQLSVVGLWCWQGHLLLDRIVVQRSLMALEIIAHWDQNLLLLLSTLILIQHDLLCESLISWQWKHWLLRVAQ